MSLFGSSGIRGRVNEDFTLELASRIGMAVGSGAKKAAVGMDARTSGPMIESAVSSGLMACGCEVYSAGLVTTPTLAEAARRLDCGIMVTASHNPPEYSGIKLWNPDGSGFGTAQTRMIEKALDARRFKPKSWNDVGRRHVLPDAVLEHEERILSGVGSAKLKVVVDCANGPAFNITPSVLRRMGCRVITINSNPDGHFPGRPPEPLEENLEDLKHAVVSAKADLGIAHDGDADRMVAVDETGAYLGGDLLLALFAGKFGKRKIVVTVDTSMAIDDYTDAKVLRTRVGDVFVSEEVKRSKADFGGEPSGTWIFPDQTYCPDGVLAAARLVEMVARSRKPLSQLRARVPVYPNIRGSTKFDPKLRQEVAKRVEREMKGMDCEEVLTIDGWRLQFEDGWALVRFSGTEPKIRFVAEARDDKTAKEIASRILAKIRRCVK